jgi:hypothetical protein
MVVARFLKINYLWVDSLTIIQNSESNWLAEVERMEDVYSNGICNIAASSSTDSNCGFIQDIIRFMRPIMNLH